MKFFSCLLVLMLSLSHSVNAATLEVITNGGFEAGNTGFTSDFTDLSPGLAFNSGTRSTTDPVTDYFGVDAFEGNWMLAAVTIGNPAAEQSIWEQEVWLEAGVAYYDFSMRLASTESTASQVMLSNRLDGVEFSSFNSYLGEDQWGGLFSSFANVTTTGFHTISIVDISTVSFLHFAVDNVSLLYDVPDAQVPLPAGGILLLTALLGMAVQKRRSN
jgi:hypothetical protein